MTETKFAFKKVDDILESLFISMGMELPPRNGSVLHIEMICEALHEIDRRLRQLEFPTE